MRKGLTKGTIEAGIMGNDGIFGLDERPHRRHVDHLAVDHGVCDTGQSSDVGRDRNARLLQPVMDAGDISDLVFPRIETGGFCIENDASERIALALE